MLDSSYLGLTNVGDVSQAVIRAAINGELDDVEYATDPIFGFAAPTECPEVPSELLDPRSTWTDPAAYDARAKELAGLFSENFQEFAAQAGEEIVAAGPVAG
ncbi:MAG: phosphoenolpyruvate carboxykinase (ATP) [Acidimicrobiia bacterium]|nr:phosphoenolpyruvate carboxykinase (ATP) [Acidimicrobiia bacterium]